MKLDKFKKNKKYKNTLLMFGIFVLVFGGGFLLYRSYANYEENKSYNVLKGQVGNFVKNDVNIIAMSLDGQSITKTPEKNDYIVNVTCDMDAEAYWDNDSWELRIKNFEKGTKCSVAFETSYLTNYIKYLANSSDELLVDETEDKNLRYVGGDPNNYVLFNNELWRIIGVMNDVKNEEGISESRVKLVRAESIGTFSWNYKEDKTFGENWSDVPLQRLLNGAYYTKTTGTYYNASSTPTTVDFTEIGLSEEARNQIDVASWGIANSSETQANDEPYIKEKQIIWYGNVALLSPSDIIYSVSGNESIDRNTCFNTRILNWARQADYAECKNTAWALKVLKDSTWSINTDGTKMPLMLNGSNLYPYLKASTIPSVYLKSNVYYVSGTGSSSDPFIIK